MPNYKKKKHNRFLGNYKKPISKKSKKNNSADDVAQNEDYYEKSSNLKVVEGKRRERLRKFKIASFFVIIAVATVIILETALPAGIIKSADMAIKLMGKGEYPIELASTETKNVVTKGKYYHILGNTHIDVFSLSGKQLLHYEHGLENPVLKTSAAYSLVYDQGGTEVLVFDISDKVYSFVTKNPILTAAISDRGNFAVSTTSKKYAAQVTVYKLDGTEIYEWYSAEDMVNNVALSSNGKKLAVSVLNSGDGANISSKISVLNFSSATPLYTESFKNTLVYRIESAFSSYFTVVTSNTVKTYKWSNFKLNSYNNDYSISFFKSYKNGYIAVFARENDKTDNRVVLLNKKGEKTADFTYRETISDISAQGKHIYCMSETVISVLDESGKTLNTVDCGFGGREICVLNSDFVAVISDNKIEKIKLSKE